MSDEHQQQTFASLGGVYAVAICQFTPCQPDLHVWSSPKPDADHLCHCGLKAWSDVTLAAGVDPAPVRPFDRKDLQELHEAMAGAPFTLGELAAAIRRSPKSMASVIKAPDAR